VENIFQKEAVKRVKAAIEANALPGEVKILSESARTAKEAATALGVEVGQIASSLVFKTERDQPLLIITSGRHRVDIALVEKSISHQLLRADADWVKAVSGFSVGGVAPLGWQSDNLSLQVLVFIDEALSQYPVIWAAAGHPHAVFPTNFQELQQVTGASSLKVALE
jgi:prolyl-tRNA editing enzyme YbaK/EbsC (Cys-tRNA(Pro) deacylase)